MSDYEHDGRVSPAAGGDSIVSLFQQLTAQGADLAQQQVELIRAEVRESVNDIKQGIAAMAGAAVVGIAGLGVLLMGLAYALAEVTELWIATLIVAIVTLVIAFILFLGGRKKLQAGNFDVERSLRTIKRAPGAVTGHAGEGEHS